MKDVFTAYIIFFLNHKKWLMQTKMLAYIPNFTKKKHIHVWYTYLPLCCPPWMVYIITVHQILSSVQTNVTYTVKPNSKLGKKNNQTTISFFEWFLLTC